MLDDDISIIGIGKDNLIQGFEAGPSILSVSLASCVFDDDPRSIIYCIVSLEKDRTENKNNRVMFLVRRKLVQEHKYKGTSVMKYWVTRISDGVSGILAFVSGHRGAGFYKDVENVETVS